MFICKLSSTRLLWEGFLLLFPRPTPLVPAHLGENPCPDGEVHFLLCLLSPPPCSTVLCLHFLESSPFPWLAYPSLWSSRGECFSVCVCPSVTAVSPLWELCQLCRASQQPPWHTVTCQLGTQRLKEQHPETTEGYFKEKMPQHATEKGLLSPSERLLAWGQQWPGLTNNSSALIVTDRSWQTSCDVIGSLKSAMGGGVYTAETENSQICVVVIVIVVSLEGQFASRWVWGLCWFFPQKW